MGVLEDLYKLYTDNPNEAIPRAGWCVKSVDYELVINQQGDIIRCSPLLSDDGEKTGINLVVPNVQRSGKQIKPYFLVDNSEYIFGTSKKHDKFVAFHKEVLSGLDNEHVHAYINFLNKDIDIYSSNKLQCLLEKDQEKAAIAFRTEGEDCFLHEIPEVKNAWSNYITNNLEGSKSICSISGKNSHQATLFYKITGLFGGQSAGSALISFNEPAFVSYGRDPKKNKGFSIGYEAAAGIGQALAYVLKDKKHRAYIGGDIIGFWVDSEPEEVGSIFNFFGIKQEDKKVEKSESLDKVRSELKQINQACLSKNELDDLNYHLLAISPNSARLSLHFYETGSFGSLKENINAFLSNVEMVGVEPRPLFLYLKELVPEGVSFDKEKNYLPANLVRAALFSIVKGKPLPRSLYLKILDRMRADFGIDTRYHFGLRAALMREHLNYIKKRTLGNDYEKEKINVALNIENANTGYLLGRLFALLEKAQHEASGVTNASIKDRYMTAAAATPSKVFSNMLGLYSHHISKIEKNSKGIAIYIDKQVGEIIDMLDSEQGFPKHLTLEDQGMFYIGYYQQFQDFYRKKETLEDNATE